MTYTSELELKRFAIRFGDALGLSDIPDKVIVNDPAVVIYGWPHGRRYVAKAQEGDQFDPEIGVLVCCLKMVTKNKGRVDDWEDMLRKVTEYHTPSEYFALSNVIFSASGEDWKSDGIDVKCMFDESFEGARELNMTLVHVLRSAALAWERINGSS